MLALAMLALIATGCTSPTTTGNGTGSTTTPTASEPADPQPSTDEPKSAAPSPGQAQECPAGTCAEGLECIEYYGIAGTSGPKFTSCEMRCKSGACPDGQQCVTISDGPGQVCRPK